MEIHTLPAFFLDHKVDMARETGHVHGRLPVPNIQREIPVSTRPQNAILSQLQFCRAKTGQPDQLVQCAVAPCHDFEPPSPFVTCEDNYCGGCHAILCGILLEDVSGGVQPSGR